MLAAVLAVEILELLVLVTLARRHVADTRERFRSDWNLVRWVVLGIVAWQCITGAVGLDVLLFIAVVLAGAECPLYISCSPRWRERLQTDVWIVLGIVFGATMLPWLAHFPPVPGIRVPADGIIHTLVVSLDWRPQEILAMGTFYFIPKTLLNGCRFASDRKAWQRGDGVAPAGPG